VSVNICIFYCSVLVLYSVSCTSIIDQKQEGVIFLSQEEKTELRDNMEAWLANEELVGGELLILRSDDTLFHHTIGWMNREENIPFQKNTICRLRSMTKPIVGTCILMLVEEGKIAIDDQVSTYLPSFANSLSGEITIRQLLTHTSGIEDLGYEGYVQSSRDFKNLEAYVDRVGQLGPIYLPGTMYRYSDPGSSTLAHLVSKISGMSAEDFIHRRIIVPLGMSHTFCNLGDDYPERSKISCTYRLTDGVFERYWLNSQPQTHHFFRGSGGMYSNISDYSIFLSMWANGGIFEGKRYLKEETIKEALRGSDINNSYGFQWSLYSYTDDEAMEHSVFGHGGSDGTWVMADWDRGLSVLYFTQSRGGTTRVKLKKLLEKYFDLDLHKE